MCSTQFMIAALDGAPELLTCPHNHAAPTPAEPPVAEPPPVRRGVGRRRALAALLGGGLGVAGGAALAAAPAAARLPAADAIAPGRTILDLTHPLSPDFPVFRLYVRQPRFQQVMFEKIVGFNTGEWTFNEHSGTHIDVPAHAIDGTITADQVKLEDLVAPLVVVRIAERAARENTTEVTVDDLLAWERRNGRIPDRAFVAMDSGWAKRVNDAQAYLQFDLQAQVMRFPGMGPEAAEFLLKERSIVGFGTDTSSLEVGTRAEPLVHRMLLHTGRYGLENLAGLDKAPEKGATILIGVPKLRGGFGAPVRAMAFL